MKTFDTATGIAAILNDRVALIRVRAGMEVGYDNGREVLHQIDDAMPADYGIIIDRAEDYSLDPVAVYQISNNLSRLKALAIVVYRDRSMLTAEIDKRLSRKDIAIFSTIDEAKTWIESKFAPVQA